MYNLMRVQYSLAQTLGQMRHPRVDKWCAHLNQAARGTVPALQLYCDTMQLEVQYVAQNEAQHLFHQAGLTLKA
jgi:hypothetical protein